MATVFTRCRSRGWLMALGLAIFAFAPGTASAQWIDPATLQIGPGTTSDPVRIGDSGLVTVTQITNGASDLDVPWQLILGIPNVTSTTATITSVNGSSSSITGSFKASMTSVNSPPADAYSLLGPPFSSADTNSNNFPNWSGADLTFNGITATSFGLFVYNIPVTLSAKETDTFQFANLPVGTFVIAFGTDTSTNKLYDTAFTNAGLTTVGPPPVPEPSTMAIAGLGAIGFVGYGLRRRLKK